MARKNGKTALIACLVLVHLVGPEAIPNDEIYSAANDREQAAQIFKVAAQIVRADPELAVKLRITDSTKTIANHALGSVYRALSSEVGTKHGLNPSLVIYDELAQSKSRDLYDVMDTSMGAREEPLMIVISTQSNDPQHILSQLIDDGLNSDDPSIVCHLYAVPETVKDDDIYNEDVWKHANPALGVFRNIEDMRSMASKAKRMPSEEPKFKNLYLNMRVSPHAPFISRADWKACEGDTTMEKGERVYLGLDLSSVNDLSALAILSAEPDDDRINVLFWKPRDFLREHSNRDFGHGNWRYEEWEADGYLYATDGKVIDHESIARKLLELTQDYHVVSLGYDRHKIEYLQKDMTRIDMRSYKDGEAEDGLKLVPWGQGYVSMSPAIDAFELAVSERTLVHPNNPLFNWNIANALVISDPAGNRKLDKSASRFRIDGAVAAAIAKGVKDRDLNDEAASLSDFLSNAVMR